MENDLITASRETLLALVGEQQKTIAQLEAIVAQSQATISELQKRIAVLEQRLTTRGGPGMPGNKPTDLKTLPRKGKHKKRPHGFSRSRMTPTEYVDHAVDTCPECGTHLCGGWVQRTREVLEIPVQPVRVIEHQFIARECPLCRKQWMPKKDVLEGVVVGQQRVGINLMSLIATLREEGRLPFEKIQWYLETLHQLHLSVGELVDVVHRTAARAKQAVEQIRDRIRASPVVHADETGWRQDGKNGYVWTFSTPTERCFLRRGRQKEVVDEVLDESFSGVLVSDFYAGYHHYPGLHQRCWAHLLRDAHALRDVYPDDAGLGNWSDAVYTLYQEAKAFAAPDERVREHKRLELEERLLKVCRPFVDDPLAVQAKLCRRIRRFIRELLVFVQYPEVPSENNAAERSP
ncbi:MAG: IS66 family transposase [Chloroflexota bacterium]|nr:MAG: IS66 family transposase [Chloroflexota bacterium]